MCMRLFGFVQLVTYAPINVKPEGGGGRAKGRELTFLCRKFSKATPSGQSWKSISHPPGIFELLEKAIQ